MYTKVILFSELDCRLFLEDILEFVKDDITVDKLEEISYEEFKDRIASAWEVIIEEEEVAGIVVFVKNDAYAIYSGKNFVYLLERDFRLENYYEDVIEELNLNKKD